MADGDATGLLNAALDAVRAGDPAGEAMLAGLRRRLPGWDEVPLRQAEMYRGRGEAARAIAGYEAVLELQPRRVEALLSLGALVLVRGEVHRAQSLFLQCCGIAPDLPEAWDALGSTLVLTGDHGAAESAFAQAQTLAPDNIGFAVHRSEAAFQAGGGAEEVARLECALERDPANAAVLTALAQGLERVGRRDEAIDYLMLAAALAPDHAIPHASLAQCLVRANRVAEALGALDRAIALAPDDLTLRNNRAASLIRLHRHREARDELRVLIADHGEHGGLLNNLSNALVSLGEQDEGAALAARAVAAEPRSTLAWRTLCNALPYCEGIGGGELLAAALGGAEVLPRGEPPVWRMTADPERALRVGLLSPTLKTHPTGWLTIAGLENLDPRRFSLHAVGPEHGADPIFRRFRMVAASWTGLDGLGMEAQVARIRGLELDVLIDLGGYGDQGLLPLCAHRLAPVQVKWVGSQNHSTGLAEMDWFVSDRWETPAENAGFYAERLMVMPDGYVCYSPPPYAPDVAPLPALGTGGVTFGCFNNLAKITRGTVAAWAGILAAVPGSRLVVKCHQMADAGTRAGFVAQFAALGIDPARVQPRGGSPHRALLGEYGDIDIVLDPFPYSGGLTTCEALWMGVPVVTMPGEIFAARHSASHLGNVGLGEWVAADVAAYQALAVAWAGDLAGLAALRAGLRERMRGSPLCDGPRFGANFGAALRMAWRDWCGGRAMAHAA